MKEEMNMQKALPLAVQHLELCIKIEKEKANPIQKDIDYYERKIKEYKKTIQEMKL